MSRFPIPAPRSDEGTLLPAMLLGILVAMIALQLWLTGGTEPLPVEDASPTRSRYRPPEVTTVAASSVILESPMFSPTRTMGGDAGSGGGDPLQGAQVAGAFSIGRQSRLVLRKADGMPITIRLGESFNGWQFAGATAEGARFRRAGEAVVIPYGASAPNAQANGEEQSEEEEQQ